MDLRNTSLDDGHQGLESLEPRRGLGAKKKQSNRLNMIHNSKDLTRIRVGAAIQCINPTQSHLPHWTSGQSFLVASGIRWSLTKPAASAKTSPQLFGTEANADVVMTPLGAERNLSRLMCKLNLHTKKDTWGNWRPALRMRLSPTPLKHVLGLAHPSLPRNQNSSDGKPAIKSHAFSSDSKANTCPLNVAKGWANTTRSIPWPSRHH